jgi:tetratricopeptide (TPR) repeat protein
MITDLIEVHFRGAPRGPAGNLALDDLRVLEGLLQRCDLRSTAETGCGISTILLGAMSAHHAAFAEDDRAAPMSAVRAVLECPVKKPDVVEFVYGSPGFRLPMHKFPHELDFVLLAGCHPHPFPAYELSRVCPCLRIGTGLLALDDIHLAHIRPLYDRLIAHPGFALAGLSGALAVFRRTGAALDGLSLDPVSGRLVPGDSGADEAAVLRALAQGAAERGTTDLERAQILANLGRAEIETDDREAAERAFRASIALQSDNAEAYDGLARTAIPHDPLTAFPLRRWASLLAPNNAGIRLRLAQDLIRAGRFDDAAKALLALLTVMPGHFEALELLGDLLAATGHSADAEACRIRARETGPEGASPVYTPGTVLEFDATGNAQRNLGRGWHAAERWGRWTRGGKATVELPLDGEPLDPSSGLKVLFELICLANYATDGFKPSLSLSVNGRMIWTNPISATITSGPVSHAAWLDPGLFRFGRTNTVGLRYSTPLVPALTGDIDDRRVIGLGVTAIRLSFGRPPVS